MIKIFSENHFEGDPLEKMSSEEIFKEKMQMTRFALNQKAGAANLELLAEYMYEILFNPEKNDLLIEELKIEDTEKFPNKTRIFKKGLPNNLKNPPLFGEFREVFIRALTKEVDFDKCLNEGVEPLLAAMINLGPIRIWTAGDVYGLKGYKKGEGQEDKDFRASREQLFKIARAGLGDIREKLAKEKFSSVSKKQVKRYANESLSIRAMETKFSLIPKICEEFLEKGIDTIVIIEDQLRFIIKAQDEIKKEGNFRVIPIWVRQGVHKKAIPKDGVKDIEQYSQDFNAVNSIKEIKDKLNSLGISKDSKVGFMLDFDGVLMNDEKRQNMQTEAVLNALKRKGLYE